MKNSCEKSVRPVLQHLTSDDKLVYHKGKGQYVHLDEHGVEQPILLWHLKALDEQEIHSAIALADLYKSKFLGKLESDG